MTKYKYLTEDIKLKLRKASEHIYVNVEDLDSYEYHCQTSPLNYRRSEPAYDEYDEEEYSNQQLRKLIEYIESDGFYEYIDYTYDEDNEEKMEKLNQECIEYLNSLL